MPRTERHDQRLVTRAGRELHLGRAVGMDVLALVAVAALAACRPTPHGHPCRGVDCSGHGQCETGGAGTRPVCVCDQGFHTAGLECLPGEAPVDADGDADDDADVIPDADLDGEGDAAADVEEDVDADVDSDVGGDADGDADHDPDLDPDHDADRDTESDAPGLGCPEHMVEIPWFDLCVDAYEASVGAGGAAASLPGADPWTSINWADAAAACAAAGKRLCSPAEWESACGGPEETEFPYGDTYEPDRCNTLDHGIGHALPTGSMTGCTGGYPGIFDMSGNVFEWVGECLDGECYMAGGAFEGDHEYTHCRVVYRSVELASVSHLGFRCCVLLKPPEVFAYHPTRWQANVPIDQDIHVTSWTTIDLESAELAFSIDPPVGYEMYVRRWWAEETATALTNEHDDLDPTTTDTVRFSTDLLIGGARSAEEFAWQFSTGIHRAFPVPSSMDRPVFTMDEHHPGSLTFTVTWGAVSGAVSYHLQESLSEHFDYVSREWTPSEPFLEVTVPMSNQYYYRVRASDGAAHSEWSRIYYIQPFG